jgi:hypothetical protein
MLTEKDILKEIDELLKHKNQLSEAEYEETLKMREDSLNIIQKELLEERRKKINKIMNIPEPPKSEERLKKEEMFRYKLTKAGYIFKKDRI